MEVPSVRGRRDPVEFITELINAGLRASENGAPKVTLTSGPSCVCARADGVCAPETGNGCIDQLFRGSA